MADFGSSQEQRALTLILEIERGGLSAATQESHAAEMAALMRSMLSRICHLENEAHELDGMRERMSRLLRATAAAVYGPESPDSRWSWERLPSDVAALAANAPIPRGTTPVSASISAEACHQPLQDQREAAAA